MIKGEDEIKESNPWKLPWMKGMKKVLGNLKEEPEESNWFIDMIKDELKGDKETEDTWFGRLTKDSQKEEEVKENAEA